MSFQMAVSDLSFTGVPTDSPLTRFILPDIIGRFARNGPFTGTKMKRGDLHVAENTRLRMHCIRHRRLRPLSAQHYRPYRRDMVTDRCRRRRCVVAQNCIKQGQTGLIRLLTGATGRVDTSL